MGYNYKHLPINALHSKVDAKGYFWSQPSGPTVPVTRITSSIC